jgi:hypothetical protein
MTVGVTDFTTSGLINNVRLRITMPGFQQLYLDSDILTVLNDEYMSTILEWILSVREEYLVNYVDYAIPTNISNVEGAADVTFNIPADAIGGRLRDVFVVNESNGEMMSLNQLDLDKVASWGYNYGWLRNAGFYLNNNQIILYPADGAAGTLRVYYYQRPYELCLNTNAAEILSIDTVNNLFTVSYLPSNWSVGTVICATENDQPFEQSVTGVAITSISYPTIGIADVSKLKIGQWVTLDGQTVFPKVPKEIWRLIPQAASVNILKSLADPNWQVAQSTYDQMSKKLLNLIGDRVTGEPKKITTRGNGIIDSLYTQGRRYWPL